MLAGVLLAIGRQTLRLRIRAVGRRILNESGRRRMLSIVDKGFLESHLARLSYVCRLTRLLLSNQLAHLRNGGCDV